MPFNENILQAVWKIHNLTLNSVHLCQSNHMQSRHTHTHTHTTLKLIWQFVGKFLDGVHILKSIWLYFATRWIIIPKTLIKIQVLERIRRTYGTGMCGNRIYMNMTTPMTCACGWSCGHRVVKAFRMGLLWRTEVLLFVSFKRKFICGSCDAERLKPFTEIPVCRNYFGNEIAIGCATCIFVYTTWPYKYEGAQFKRK